MGDTKILLRVGLKNYKKIQNAQIYPNIAVKKCSKMGLNFFCKLWQELSLNFLHGMKTSYHSIEIALEHKRCMLEFNLKH